jgi:hypothetical protein
MLNPKKLVVEFKTNDKIEIRRFLKTESSFWKNGVS